MKDNWKVVPKKKQIEMMRNGKYISIDEISPHKFNDSGKGVYDSDIEYMVSLGDKLEILDTCGNISYHTLTAYMGVNGPAWGVVVRNESGDNLGEEVCIDSGFFERYDIGFKVLNKFPWEVH